jgi:hypothetical protein
MFRPRQLIALSFSTLAACAGLDCGSDWQEIGQRDGRLGADSQIEYYAARCGGNVDRTRYAAGWESGTAMRPRISSF